MALPSLKELSNIIAYFDMIPSEFFALMENQESPYHQHCEKLWTLNDDDLQKVSLFLE